MRFGFYDIVSLNIISNDLLVSDLFIHFSLRKMNRTVGIASILSCLVGLTLSLYAYYVETRKESDETYQAMCDFSEHVSCSAVFNSRYGKGFGLLNFLVEDDSVLNQPNSVFGIIFYFVLLCLGESEDPSSMYLYLGLAILSNIGSVYLGYILIYILHDFCVVCVATYVLNAILLACAIYKYKGFKSNVKVE